MISKLYSTELLKYHHVGVVNVHTLSENNHLNF